MSSKWQLIQLPFSWKSRRFNVERLAPLLGVLILRIPVSPDSWEWRGYGGCKEHKGHRGRMGLRCFPQMVKFWLTAGKYHNGVLQTPSGSRFLRWRRIIIKHVSPNQPEVLPRTTSTLPTFSNKSRRNKKATREVRINILTLFLHCSKAILSVPGLRRAPELT